MRVRAILLAATLVLVPFAARAADLVVWWQGGVLASEDDAAREMVAAFEHKTGKTVELTFFPQDALPEKVQAALGAGQPPDFEFGDLMNALIPQWAEENRLVDLSSALGDLARLIDGDALAWCTMPNRRTGRSGLYCLPMTRQSTHVHVWRSLLERAGLSLADIPKDWEGFWSFWCDKAQPAVRKATGRDDIYGVGLSMSDEANETGSWLNQFAAAFARDWPVPWATSLTDDPQARATLIRALRDYTGFYKKGCTPPQSRTWTNLGNNEAFLAQTVIMTINQSLSIPGVLRATRPEDYYKNAVTIEWPSDAYGQPVHIEGNLNSGIVFAAGRHVEAALEFVRFLVGDGWLAHWLSFAGDRYLPVLTTLTDQPFWLDPGNPHLTRAVMQVMTHPHVYGWWGLPQAQRRHEDDFAMAMRAAVHRVEVDGHTPEQAADEMILRMKQLLSE